MKLVATALVAALALAPVPGFAHGEPPAPAHGGWMQEAGELFVELVVKGSDVAVYVLDQDRKPVPAAQASGTATVLVAGKSHKVALTPGEGNALHGTLPVAASGRVIATVALKVGGKSASARFVPPG